MAETKQVIMSISDLDMENFDFFSKSDVMKTFVEFGTQNKVSLQITIKNLEVKYLPTRYDKLVLIPNAETEELLEQWQEHAKREVDVENYVKNGSFGCRPSAALKENLVKTVKEGDFIDIVITYNGVSNYQEKWYPSFTLQQFRKTKSAAKKVVNLFAD